MTENRLINLMESGKQKMLSIFVTAGYPEIDDTLKIVKALDKAGVDFIELGMPFSDPLADGPTIQRSNERALKNGMSLHKLFDDLKDLRNVTSTPILLMGYLNIVENYGIEAFCKKCKEIGIDGVILPDLPLHIYKVQYEKNFDKYNLSNIFLITPQTSEERIHEYDRNTTGFIYAVSSASTTGTKDNINESEAFLKKLQSLRLQNPIITGFNIKDAESFNRASTYTRGGIIGSAFIKAIEKSTNLEKDIIDFISTIRL